jgi:hypothetical protein
VQLRSTGNIRPVGQGTAARGLDTRTRDDFTSQLPGLGDYSLLRRPDGQILVYEEHDDKRSPVTLRGLVMPDGQVVDLHRRRFTRRAAA